MLFRVGAVLVGGLTSTFLETAKRRGVKTYEDNVQKLSRPLPPPGNG